MFEVVSLWKQQRGAKTSLHRALIAAKQRGTSRVQEPFAVVICCTSDAQKLDAKTRSKWSRVLRCAEQFKPNAQGLARFIKSKGGINECAAQWSDRLR